MSDDEHPPEADVKLVSFQLHQSLRACRAMVIDYRLMLGGEANDNERLQLGDGFAKEETSEAEEA